MKVSAERKSRKPTQDASRCPRGRTSATTEQSSDEASQERMRATMRACRGCLAVEGAIYGGRERGSFFCLACRGPWESQDSTSVLPSAWPRGTLCGESGGRAGLERGPPRPREADAHGLRCHARGPSCQRRSDAALLTRAAALAVLLADERLVLALTCAGAARAGRPVRRGRRQAACPLCRAAVRGAPAPMAAISVAEGLRLRW